MPTSRCPDHPRRPRIIHDYLEKIEELVEHRKGRMRADVVHDVDKPTGGSDGVGALHLGRRWNLHQLEDGPHADLGLK